MKKSLTLILISISLITLFSCKKKEIIIPEPTLPEITSSGLNTFGFMSAKEVKETTTGETVAITQGRLFIVLEN